MSFYIGDAAVHNVPLSFLAQEEAELQAEVRALRRAFGQLAREILILIINAILRAMGLGEFIGPLDGAITAVENALLDIPKGNIQGLVTNLGNLGTNIQEIIDTILNGLGIPGVGHAVGEIYGALKVIADLIADLEKALQIAGTSTPTGLIQELRGLLPAAIPQFNGTALSASVPGFVDNGNGTISYTAQDGINAVSHLIQQADGTVVTAAQATQQAAAAAASGGAPNIGQAVAAGQQVVDQGLAALQGTLPGGLVSIGNHAHLFGGAFSKHLTGLFNGWTGSSIPTATASDVSFAAQQAAIAAANAAQLTASITAQLPHFYGGTGANGNNYSIPLGAIPATGFTLTNGVEVYNSALLTDSQTVSAIWNQTLSWTAGVSEVRTVLLRSDTAGTTYCFARMSLTADPSAYVVYGYWVPTDASSNFKIEIGCHVAGVETVFQTWTYPLWYFSGVYYYSTPLYTNGPGYTYRINAANHVFAFEATVYDFVVDFSGLALTFTDSSHVSQKGASYLSGGFSVSIKDPLLQMSWDFYDSGPTSGPGTALVATQENTTSATFTDLATTTDQVTINIGNSGMALVMISADVQQGTDACYSTFGYALSGANTASASFNKCWYLIADAGHGILGMHAVTFLETGLSQGATTFKMKYCSQGGGTGIFSNRRISVIPL
jgi:hypothetical protein